MSLPQKRITHPVPGVSREDAGLEPAPDPGTMGWGNSNPPFVPRREAARLAAVRLANAADEFEEALKAFRQLQRR